MSTFERYVFRELLGPFGFFVLVLTGVIWLTQSLRVIDTVVNNGQSAQVFLEFTVLLLPTVLALVLLLGALAATVYTLHRLLSESEVVAAYAGGASRMRAARPVALFGLCAMTIMAVDTLYLIPVTKKMMRDRVAEVRADLAAGLIRDGRFMHPAYGLTVYIRQITPRGELLGVMVQDARDRESPVTYTAKRGFLTRQSENPTLVMFDGQAQRLEAQGERLSLLRFDSFAYDLSEFVSSDSSRRLKPSERFFWELINPDPADAPTPREVGRFVAEGHEQLSAPLYALALPLAAAAILLGAAHTRRGLGGRVALALAVGAGVRVLGIAAKATVTGQPHLWPLMYAPPLLCTVWAYYALNSRRFGNPRQRIAATRDDDDDGLRPPPRGAPEDRVSRIGRAAAAPAAAAERTAAPSLDAAVAEPPSGSRRGLLAGLRRTKAADA